MTGKVRIAFDARVIELELSDILPLRQLTPQIEGSKRFGRIVASINTVGLAEPLVVAKQKRDEPCLLVDGHLRYYALQKRGDKKVRCIVADDDEAFTYNKRVNRLATVQEHYMIDRAVRRGASEEKIARAFGADVNVVRRRRNLLTGITAEVASLLAERSISIQTFEVLKKMKAARQFEAAELMVSLNNFSQSYAKALLAATSEDDLTKPNRKRRVGGLTPEQMARMEREMENLSRDMKAVEDGLGDDVLHLVVASRYLGKLLANERITAYLERRHPEISAEFQAIISNTSLEQSSH